MDKDLKAKWVAALRSGEYSQTQGTLKRRLHNEAPGFCCIGVLCDVSEEGSWRAGDFNSDEIQFEFDSGETIVGELQEEMCESFGFTPERQVELIRLNDGHDNMDEASVSFNEIADYIEENL